jgi:outer membrane protein assembly factor BamB
MKLDVMKLYAKLALVAGCVFLMAGVAQAQLGRGGAWGTNSGDPQRTGWQKNETEINKDSVKGLKLLWKLKVDNQTRALHSLLQPIVVAATYRNLVIVAGSSDNLYAIDSDLGKIAWSKHFEYSNQISQNANPTWLCPGGLTATPVEVPPVGFGRGRGAAVVAGGGGRAAGAGVPAATGGRGVRSIYALSSDGSLHQLNIRDGEELAPTVKFIPPNGKPYGLNLVDNVLYTATGQGCGGLPNAVHAIDLGSPEKTVASFNSGGGGIWGLAGPAVGTDGTVYVETGDGPFDPEAGKFSDTFLALSPKDLKLKDYFMPLAAPWFTKRDLDLNDTPVVFPYKGRDLIVGSGKESSLFMLDSTSLGGSDHRTPLFRSPMIGNEDVAYDAHGIWGNLASWEDPSGTRWVLAPLWGPLASAIHFPLTNGDAPHGSIVALKLEEKNGKPVLTPAWVSRDLISPAPPVIANGVVFALSSGEYTVQNGPDRVANSTHAILYALDAQTGKELYSSGDIITSFTHFSGLAVAGGQVFLGTYDNTVYGFGFPMER